MNHHEIDVSLFRLLIIRFAILSIFLLKHYYRASSALFVLLFVEKSIRVAKNIQCYNLIYVILTKNVRAFIRLISISTLGFQGGEARENMEKSHGRERAIDHTTLDTFVFAYNERSRNDCTSRAKFLARHERNKSRPLESYLPMHETEELSAAMFQLYYIASSRSVSILQLSRRCNRVFARKQLKKTTLVNC